MNESNNDCLNTAKNIKKINNKKLKSIKMKLKRNTIAKLHKLAKKQKM